MKRSAVSLLLSLASAGASQASLWVDFNSTNQDSGPHNNAGYQPYSRGHEVEADLGAAGNRTEVYPTTFAISGPASVSLTSDWTNTSDIRVRQSIDRGAGNDANWTGANLDLVTDFLGIDTRTANGGNGNWDGTAGTPTYMTLGLSGLPAGTYRWTSFHHDTEHVHVDFAVWIDTGAGFAQLGDGSMTDSTPGGNPDSMNTVADFAGMVANGSVYQTVFAADGVGDVTFRFAPYANTAVHSQIWGINGFQLEQIPEPSTGILALLGVLGLLRRRR